MKSIAAKHDHVKKAVLSFLHIDSETVIKNLNLKSKMILNNFSDLNFSNQILTSFSTQKQVSREQVLIFKTKNLLFSVAFENKNQISFSILNQSIRQKIRNMKIVKNKKNFQFKSKAISFFNDTANQKFRTQL